MHLQHAFSSCSNLRQRGADVQTRNGMRTALPSPPECRLPAGQACLRHGNSTATAVFNQTTALNRSDPGRNQVEEGKLLQHVGTTIATNSQQTAHAPLVGACQHHAGRTASIGPSFLSHGLLVSARNNDRNLKASRDVTRYGSCSQSWFLCDTRAICRGHLDPRLANSGKNRAEAACLSLPLACAGIEQACSLTDQGQGYQALRIRPTYLAIL
jgi:hypothetical protein